MCENVWMQTKTIVFEIEERKYRLLVLRKKNVY